MQSVWDLFKRLRTHQWNLTTWRAPYLSYAFPSPSRWNNTRTWLTLIFDASLKTIRTLLCQQGSQFLILHALTSCIVQMPMTYATPLSWYTLTVGIRCQLRHSLQAFDFAAKPKSPTSLLCYSPRAMEALVSRNAARHRLHRLQACQVLLQGCHPLGQLFRTHLAEGAEPST